MNSIGKNLRELRKAEKITQNELAAEFGIGQDDISRYENDKQILSIDMLKLYCKRFHVPADFILGLKGNVNEKDVAFIRKNTGLSEKAINALHDYLIGFSFIDFQERWNNTTVNEKGDKTVFENPSPYELFEKMDVINFFLGFDPDDEDLDEYFKRFTRIIYDYHKGITANIRIKKEFIPLLSQHIKQLKADSKMDSMPYEYPDYFREINNSEKEIRYRTFELQGLMLDFIDDYFENEKTEYNKIEGEYKKLEKKMWKLMRANRETRKGKGGKHGNDQETK